DGDKPSKDKGQSSGSEGDDIDQYDSLFLHNNDTNDCICENSKKLKKHNQLIKLMQFLMRLEEVYAPIKSIILITDPVPDVKGAFAMVSIDESHRSTQSHNLPKPSSAAFTAKTNNRSNSWSGSNNQTKILNRPNLVCTHCNMNGHTADRCFELVGYPPNFKRNSDTNRGSTSNNAILGSKDQSDGSSKIFTDDHYKRLMDLIDEKSGSSSMLQTSKLNMMVGHPNSTKALVTHVGSLKLTDKIVIHNVLVVPDYQVSLLLGHPSDQVLDILKHKLNFETNSKMDLCEVCHKTKQTREPFQISDHKTKNLGELVHLDVWGSIQGSKDQSDGSSKIFTDDHYKRRMDLIDEKSGSSSMPANIKVYSCWIIDSCASKHMTYTILNMFRIVDVSKLNMMVGHPNSTKALVTHVGSLKLTDKIVIHNVLVVPDYQVSLLLGHPSDQVLDILKHKLNFETNSKMDLCEVCHKTKQTREPFQISDYKTKNLGELVHLDVWGSIQGSK
nr:hypothetical protein [Tanacetum cinerariifolium]